jgi:protein gp37
MSDYGGYVIHPVAELFPLIEGEEFDALVADITEHGLTHPVVLSPDGTMLVDGRNRYKACIAAHLEPAVIRLGSHYTDDLIAEYIISANLRRRQLDVGQRAMVGVGIEKHLAEQAREKERLRKSASESTLHDQAKSIHAADRAAAAVGVSHSAITKAKKVVAEAPDLAEKVRGGKTSLDAAHKETRSREKAREEKPTREKPTAEVLILRTHEGVEVPYPKPKARSTFNPTNDHISWAAWSWNPVTGCLHGCDYCYARELATRESYAASYPVGFMPLFHHERLGAPANTSVPDDAIADPRRKRVFVCSMADLYGKWVPADWIKQVHQSCQDNPQWDYLLLTKFPSRYVKLDLPPTAWVGTTVDSQRRVAIAEDAFRKIEGVRVKWLSLEPLLEPLAFSDLSMFDWVVIGAQSQTTQPGNRIVPAFAPNFDWVARLVAQARDAGCAVYLKPNLIGFDPVKGFNPQAPGMKIPQEVPSFHA